MYRQYENAQALEEELRLLRVQIDRLMEIGCFDEQAAEIYHEKESELEQRINWAYQDEEFDMMNA